METRDKGCFCGARVKTRGKFGCSKIEGKSRCPCVKNGQSCDRDRCKCRSCSNMAQKDQEKRMTPCRCGEGKRKEKEETVSCADVEGRNRTKCPCFSAGLGCDGCSCYNCKNNFGINATPTKRKTQQKKRQSMLSSPPSPKRCRRTEYLRENNTNIVGGWSQLESCVLDMTESFILTSNLQPTKDNICNLYNFVCGSVSDKAINVNKKTFAQISGKLEYKNRRMEALFQLAKGQSG